MKKKDLGFCKSGVDQELDCTEQHNRPQNCQVWRVEPIVACGLLYSLQLKDQVFLFFIKILLGHVFLRSVHDAGSGFLSFLERRNNRSLYICFS